MNKKKIKLILSWTNNLRFKRFALGVHLSSEGWDKCREYYLLVSLGFWQLAIGFRV